MRVRCGYIRVMRTQRVGRGEPFEPYTVQGAPPGWRRPLSVEPTLLRTIAGRKSTRVKRHDVTFPVSPIANGRTLWCFRAVQTFKGDCATYSSGRRDAPPLRSSSDRKRGDCHVKRAVVSIGSPWVRRCRWGSRCSSDSPSESPRGVPSMIRLCDGHALNFTLPPAPSEYG